MRNNDLKEISLSYPSLTEQIRIGSLFRNLDSLITLEQQKYGKLKNLKKAMLEKMFPQPGATVPQVRFKGFSGEWEEKKFSSVGIFNPKAELPQQFRYVDLESVVGTELMSFREETKVSAPSRAQRLAQFGDFFYQTVRPYQKNNYLFDKSDADYVFSTGYAQIRPICSGFFLHSLVQTIPFSNEVTIRCTGTSYPAISANDLADISIYVPLDEKEQTRIGSFFRQLDSLIALQQRKCAKLHTLKKALLGKLFL